jgi:hypothetical protein
VAAIAYVLAMGVGMLVASRFGALEVARSRGEQVTSGRPLRIAINGYGRIGRCFLRALMESPLRERFTVVAINDPADLASIAYLTRFDSTHGRFPGNVELGDGCLLIESLPIPVFHASSPTVCLGKIWVSISWWRRPGSMVIEMS